MSANNIRDGSYTILNAYADSSHTLCTLLGNQSAIYARGTWDVTAEATAHMNGSGELAHDKLSTSALHLLTPTMRTTENIATYHDQITAVSNMLSNEKSRVFLRNYAKTAIKYALVMEAGKAVSALVDKGTPKEEIGYAKVREYWEQNNITVLDPAGNPIEKQMWGKGRSHLYRRVEPSDTVKRLIGCVDGHGVGRFESTLVKY